MSIEWSQDYVWPKLDPFKAEVGQRVWLDLGDRGFFDATITDVGMVDENGSRTMTVQRFPSSPGYQYLPQ